MLSFFSPVLLLIFNIQKGINIPCSFKNNVSSSSTVPSIRSAFRDILFPSKAYTAFSAISCLDINFYFVNKLHYSLEDLAKVVIPVKLVPAGRKQGAGIQFINVVPRFSSFVVLRRTGCGDRNERKHYILPIHLKTTSGFIIYFISFHV